MRSSRKLLNQRSTFSGEDQHDSASNSSAVYEVPVVKGYFQFCEEKSALENQVGATPSGQTAPRGKTHESSGQNTQGPLGVSPSKKERLNKDLNKTLYNDVIEFLDDHIAKMKPASKRESEMDSLRSLLLEYSVDDIALSLRYLVQFGVLGTKEKCHSPMRYLLTAIEQVVPKARECEAILQVAEGHSKVETVKQSNHQDCNELIQTALAEFQTQLSPTEQTEYVSIVVAENAMPSFTPRLSLMTKVAAMRWYESKRRIGKI
jgi:hypothetical protein